MDIFYDKRSEERDVVMSVIEGSMEKYKIDSNELDVKIPDLLLRECEKELHRVSICVYIQCCPNIWTIGPLRSYEGSLVLLSRFLIGKVSFRSKISTVLEIPNYQSAPDMSWFL